MPFPKLDSATRPPPAKLHVAIVLPPESAMLRGRNNRSRLRSNRRPWGYVTPERPSERQRSFVRYRVLPAWLCASSRSLPRESYTHRTSVWSFSTLSRANFVRLRPTYSKTRDDVPTTSAALVTVTEVARPRPSYV